MFPTIKKKITGFLLSEDGQISKSVLVAFGIVVGGLGIQTAAAQHSSTTITYQNQDQQIIGRHSLSTTPSTTSPPPSTTSPPPSTTSPPPSTTSPPPSTTSPPPSTTSCHTNRPCSNCLGHCNVANCHGNGCDTRPCTHCNRSCGFGLGHKNCLSPTGCINCGCLL